MRRNVIWLAVAAFLAICAANSLLALRKALQEKEQREAMAQR